MNSLRSLVRSSISLGANAFQEKEKNLETVVDEDTNEVADLAAGGSFEDDNDIFQEVVENEELDSETGHWRPLDSDMTRNSNLIDGKMEFPSVAIPDEVNYSAGDWEIESDSDYDDDGWSYGNDFNELDQGDCLKEFSKGKVRRRIWQRQLKLKSTINTESKPEKMSKRHSHRFTILNSITGKINGTISGMAQTASASLESAKGVSTGIIRHAEQTIVSAAAAVPNIGKSGMGSSFASSSGGPSSHSSSTSSAVPSSSIPIEKPASLTEQQVPDSAPIEVSSNATISESDEIDKKSVPIPAMSSSPPRNVSFSPPTPIVSSPASFGSQRHSTIIPGPSEVSSVVPEDTSSVAEGSVNVDDNAAFEYEDDGTRFENESVVSDAYSVAATDVGGAPNNGSAKRRSFFSTAFGSSTNQSISTKSVVSSPKEGASGANRRQSLKTVARSNDPALRVHDSTLAAIGKQIKFIESEAKKAEEEKLKTWKEEARPHLEATIANLEKKIVAIKKTIEKEAEKGYQHISKFEEELEKMIVELDVAKRCFYFPYTDITLGTGGVYLALDDFWLEYCSGGYHVEITPDRAFPNIGLRLRGVKGAEASGVQARLQIEGFRLAADKGKGVPKLNFSQIKVTIGFTAEILLKFNHKLNKWEINSKDFKINVVSFKGPYGMNRSIVGLVLSLLTPTIRHALVDNLPFELGLMIRTMPTPFTIIGDFNIRGVELSALDKEWYQAHLLAKMCDYSSTQMDMFYYLQRAMERSYPMKNCAELLSYVKQFSKNRFMWDQLVHLWEQAAMLYCEKVAIQKGGTELELLDTNGLVGIPGYKISFKTFLSMCEEMLMKRINAKSELKVHLKFLEYVFLCLYFTSRLL
jgi:hypothetical protein